ncbi:hypothetical protein LZ24_02167 [Desulfobotulus alkaliphilus]|uniref:Lipid A 3-O-deacylase PagL n=1 Tax=Desulfobotulus alkaliphilus TaxID=622671 RepID=A0A562RNU3_9BACT|nr:hypothetical protein [Desulfobotulus alkaliphilus]TWI70747.1 hypothetical protein LZ24_02167 [Desulfobotulus alkaliphilus]
MKKTGYLLGFWMLLICWPDMVKARDISLTVFGGQSTRNVWEDFFISPFTLDFADSRIAACAMAYTFARIPDWHLSFELEGQIVRHWGIQNHWESNLPVVIRHHRMPWSHEFRSSAAFGVGPSWSSDTPPLEVETRGDSQPVLFHWFMELTAGPLQAPWMFTVRLHHRSTGYKLLADKGGLDTLVGGIRWDF